LANVMAKQPDPVKEKTMMPYSVQGETRSQNTHLEKNEIDSRQGKEHVGYVGGGHNFKNLLLKAIKPQEEKGSREPGKKFKVKNGGLGKLCDYKGGEKSGDSRGGKQNKGGNSTGTGNSVQKSGVNGSVFNGRH